MSETEIQVVYEGEAVQAGTMDVRELTPALLAFGDLFEEANHLLNGDRARVAVNVRSDFQRGSFHVTLDVAQTLAAQVQGLLLGQGIQAANSLITLILGTEGLFRLVKWLKKRRPRTVVLESGRVRLSIENKYMEVPGEVAKLFNSTNVRRSAYGAVRPLTREGIDHFEARAG